MNNYNEKYLKYKLKYNKIINQKSKILKQVGGMLKKDYIRACKLADIDHTSKNTVPELKQMLKEKNYDKEAIQALLDSAQATR